jgi:hypothetical protein
MKRQLRKLQRRTYYYRPTLSLSLSLERALESSLSLSESSRPLRTLISL